MDAHENWFEDKNDILQVFTKEFCMRFKRDPKVILYQAILMSRDISNADNEWLTRLVF